MRIYKHLGALAAILALSALGAANVSAATFTASATGTLAGKALNTQVFTTNAGQVKCINTTTTGSITSTASTEQRVTVNYSGCTGLGVTGVEVSPAEYLLTASGEVHTLNTITIKIPIFNCHFTFTPQTRKGWTFSTNSPFIQASANISFITYHASGGLCGSGGSTGTFTGASQFERVGGGSLSFDP